MKAPYYSTTKNMQNLGVKILSYPELFTNTLLEGVSPAVQGFRTTGEIGPWKKVPNPGNAEDMGRLRGLTMGDGQK